MNIQIATIRQSGIRTARVVNADGSIQSRKLTLAIKMPKAIIDMAQVGSVWSVEGDVSNHSYTINGSRVEEDLMTVKAAKFLRPSGELLARWISSNIEGCGDVKARRLVRAFKDLNQVIQDKDIQALTSVSGINQNIAQRLIDQWPSEGLYAVLSWLQDSGIPVGLGDRLVRVYGEEAIEKLRTDPYILLAFGVSFKSINDVIQKLNIQIPYENRIAAIAEHVIAQHCRKTGSTVISSEDLIGGILSIDSSITDSSERLFSIALSHGAIMQVEDGYQGLGSAVQEATVARFISDCHLRENNTLSLMAYQEDDLNEQAVISALDEYESSLGFSLTKEQRLAIVNTVVNSVSIISGGAGTGKTTILQAILSIYDKLACDIPQFQVALSGRAARRMQEATGRSATTIAKLISDAHKDARSLPDHLLLIIDEASMVDLLSMYKLVSVLPEATRLIFVGDVAQLPPVAGGLIFHSLMRTNLNAVELTQVKRQCEDSGIHQLANSIRNGIYQPELLNSASGDVSYVSNNANDILEKMREFESVEDSIVLTPTKKGPLGVNAINHLIQSELNTQDDHEIHYADTLRGFIPWITRSGSKLRLGDRVMITSNDYASDIRNGDLGTITAVFDEPDEDRAFGTMNIDGRDVPINQEVLNNLELGYAITIHKSQGSQWINCLLVLPSYAPYMMDQTLIYTAITRPTNNLVVFGDESLIINAIQRGPSIEERLTDIRNKFNIFAS